MYYDGNLKLSTASSGINVVGTTTSTQLAITGVSTFTGNIDANGDLDVDGHTNLDNVSIAGVTTFSDDVTFVGANYNARWDKSGSNLEFDDNAEATFGTDQDLRIFHAVGYNYFRMGASNSEIHFKDVNNGNIAKFKAGGNNELYYNASKKFETTSTGVAITGGLTASGNSTFNADVFFVGASSKTITFDQSEGHIRYLDNAKAQFGTQGDLQIYHDGSNSYISEVGTGNLQIQSANAIEIESNTGEKCARFHPDGAVELYYDNSKKFQTLSNGASVTGNFGMSGYFTGHFVPVSNNTYDIGSSSLRWRNIYTNDLNLSNEGGANDVDGTWGSYTIQEGAEDLFLVNKRSGKKYKFALTEVS